MTGPVPADPIRLRFETANYVLRTMEHEDAERDWGDWMANPATAGLLNASPRALSVEARRTYIKRFDGRSAYLWGIFRKSSDVLVGVWSIYVNNVRKEYLLNVLIGPQDERSHGALTETRDIIYRYFFDDLGLKAGNCTVLARNTYMVERNKRRGWTVERTSLKPSTTGSALVEIIHFRLTRDAWRRVDGLD